MKQREGTTGVIIIGFRITGDHENQCAFPIPALATSEFGGNDLLF